MIMNENCYFTKLIYMHENFGFIIHFVILYLMVEISNKPFDFH